MFAGSVIVMGVSGTGKSEVASRLAAYLGRPFIEADQLHSLANLEKMARGQGLTDADRWPWLAAVVDEALAKPGPVVIACSALRRAYRDVLRERLGLIRIVFLHGQETVIRARLEARRSHFFKADLLDSQLAVLEEPGDDENVIRADITRSLDEILFDAATALGGSDSYSRHGVGTGLRGRAPTA